MMKYRFLYILLIVAVCVSSCKKKEHVIPRGKMAKIYAEMFVTDQQLTGQPAAIRAQIDTSWVYEPIFEKYGYNSDDYRASVDYYIQDANRFARIVRRSAAIIDGEIKDLKKQKALLEKRSGIERISYRPRKIFYLTGIGNPGIFGNDTIRFYVDSLGGQIWFDPRDWEDTAYYGPEIRVIEDIIIEGDEEDALAEEVSEEFEGSEGSEDVSASDEDLIENEADSLNVELKDSLSVDSVIEKPEETVTEEPAVADTLHRGRRLRQKGTARPNENGIPSNLTDNE